MVLTALARKTALADDERGLLYPLSPFLAPEMAPRKLIMGTLFAKHFENNSLKFKWKRLKNILRILSYQMHLKDFSPRKKEGKNFYEKNL